MTQPPVPPYFAVIFRSKKRPENQQEYRRVAEQMESLVTQQPGYIGHWSCQQADGESLTISYWEDEKAIAAWKQLLEHRKAQALGRTPFYEWFTVEVCQVQRAYGFTRQGKADHCP